MRPCNIRGTEARACIQNSGTTVNILLSTEQGANTIKVPIKLRSLIFIFPLLLLSSVLQSLTASLYAQIGWQTHPHHTPCSMRCGDHGEMHLCILTTHWSNATPWSPSYSDPFGVFRRTSLVKQPTDLVPRLMMGETSITKREQILNYMRKVR